jgi:polysaccharide deacetylase 2 family uncharacterized protein YibQ
MCKRWILAIFLPFWFVSSVWATSAKLAIVIDDVGYRQNERNLHSLPKEVAWSLVPAAPYASYRSRQAADQQREVLIHLPMQQKDPQSEIEIGSLTIGMASNQMSQLVRFSRNVLPNAIGLSNHLGDGATEDPTTMRNLMQVLAQQQLFFLDNRTSTQSIAYRTASEFGVRALERTATLEVNQPIEQWQAVWNQALSRARDQGFAVLTAFPEPEMVQFLQQTLAHLPKDVELTSLGKLWRSDVALLGARNSAAVEFYPAPTSKPPFRYVPLLRGIPKD